MFGRKFFAALCAAALALAVAAAPPHTFAQKKSKKQQPTTGGISGRVRVDAGASPANISVKVRRGDQEVAETTTNRKGEFEIQGLEPGSYGLTLRKAGLQVGRMENVNVRAGKTTPFKEGLFLPIDEGSIAFIKGSIFTAEGRSVFGARVDLALVGADGSLRKLDSRVSNATGSFVFKLSPEAARYRLTVKADRAEPATQDVEIDGAAIYRVAVTLNPAAK